jgi:hypothetical protein
LAWRKGFGAGAEAAFALAGDIDDGALLHGAVAVLASEGDVQGDVEGPERLATLWRAPQDGKPVSRQQAVHKVRRVAAHGDVLEPDRLELPPDRRRFGFGVGFCILVLEKLIAAKRHDLSPRARWSRVPMPIRRGGERR